MKATTVSDTDAPCQNYRRALMFDLALKGVENGTVRVVERVKIHGTRTGWAMETIKDALRCALKNEMGNEHSRIDSQ